MFIKAVERILKTSDCIFHPVVIVSNQENPNDQVIGYIKYFQDTVRDIHTDEIVYQPFSDWTPVYRVLYPDEFVSLLARGCFPIGGPQTAGTNQSLAEHDLDHMSSFIKNPEYALELKKTCEHLHAISHQDPDGEISRALKDFDSILSLRLYYFVEMVTKVSPNWRNSLKSFLQPLQMEHDQDNSYIHRDKIVMYLNKMDVQELYRFLFDLYERIPSMLIPLGGESININNRIRKHDKSFHKGLSKFTGSSIYSLYQIGTDALQKYRPDHEDYQDGITCHANMIATLIGLSKLTEKHWVDAVLGKYLSDEDSSSNELSKYITSVGVWNDSHVMYKVFSHLELPLDANVNSI